MADRYNGQATDPLASQGGITDLYRDGLAEAARVLRPGSQAWVKVGDSLASERQR